MGEFKQLCLRPTDSPHRLISAPYLNVLQTLVLSPSFPESTLRIVGSRLADLVQPSGGLDSVFKTSGFDVDGIVQKLSAAGLGPTSSEPAFDKRSAG